MTIAKNDMMIQQAAARLFNAEPEFIMGAARVEQLPPARYVEVAFAGRSNVGKSSLVNAVTGRRSLAKTSSNPGHTRQVNFFLLGGQLMLADLPGYGYARASKKEVEGWTQLVFQYLAGRPNLKRVCLLIDSRHGIKENDEEVMSMLDDVAVSYQIVLTKVDKISAEEKEKVVAEITEKMENHVALHPEILFTSSVENIGIAPVRNMMASLL